MKLFERHDSDNNRTAYTEAIPSAPAHETGGGRHGENMSCVEPVFDETGPADIYGSMTFEQLVAENCSLRRELSALKSRISHVKTVLLSDAVVAGNDLPPVDRAEPSAATADNDLQRMLAELKNDIASIGQEMHAPEPVDPAVPASPAKGNPNFEIACMLSELKADIAALRTEAAIRRLEPSGTVEEERDSVSGTGIAGEGDVMDVRNLLTRPENDLRVGVGREGSNVTDTGATDRLGMLFSQLQKELSRIAGPVRAAETAASKPEREGRQEPFANDVEEDGNEATQADGDALH